MVASSGDLGTARGAVEIVAKVKGMAETVRALKDLQAQTQNATKSIATSIESAGATGAATQAANALGHVGAAGQRAGSDIESGMEQAGRGIVKAEKSSKDLEAALTKISAVGFLVGGAVFAGLGVAVSRASDLNESISKTNVVFGSASRAVQDFATSTAKDLGISRQAALEAAATYGNLFRGIKISQGDAAQMSTTLVTLAADLASFNNFDPAQVLHDLQSGLIGETEPLRKYGVLLNEASVEQELMIEGAQKLNGEYTDAQKVQARYAIILKQTTTAQGDFARTADGVANSTRIAKAELADATAELGTTFLPIASKALQTVASLAEAFSNLPPGVQETTAQVIAVAGGLALLAAAGAKAFTIGKSVGRTWQDIGKAFSGTQKSCSDAAGCLLATGENAKTASTGLNTATASLKNFARVAAVGVIITVGADLAIDAMRNAVTGHSSDLEHLGNDISGHIADGIRAAGATSWADAVDGAVSDAQANMDARDLSLSLGFTLEQKEGSLDKQLRTFFNSSQILSPIPDSWIPDIQHADDTITELGVTVESVQKQADEAGVSFVEMVVSIAEAQGKATPEMKAYAEQTKNAREAEAPRVATLESLAKAQETMASAQHDSVGQLVENAAATQDAADADAAAAKAAQDKADAEEAAAKAAETYKKQLAEVVTNSLLEQGALQDVSSELDGIQAGYGDAEQSAQALVLAMNKAGAITLSKANREALGYAEALNQVDQNLGMVAEQTSNNQEDFDMWASRIGLVTSVLGGNTEELNRYIEMLQNGEITQQQFNDAIAGGAIGSFQKLDALYASGAISLDQYNKAKAAGVFLIQRSAGGMQDEDAELVQNIIDLAHYVKAHDDASGAVDRLTDSQREFIAATKSPVAQDFLQTLALLKSIGASPEVITKFIVDSAAADPVVAGLAEDLGLIDGEHKVTLTWDNANQVLDDLGGAADTLIDLDNKHVEVFVDTKEDALEFARRNADALDGKEVTFYLKGDHTQLDVDVGDAVDNAEGQTVDIPVQAKFDASNPLGNIPVLDSLNLPTPDPVEITAEDKTGDGVDAAKTTLAEVPVTAATEGENTSEAFATGIDSGKGAVSASVQGLVDQMNAGFQGSIQAASAWGSAAAVNFASAFVNALAGWANSAYNAGFNTAYNAKLGADAALGIHSPSRVATEIAENFGGTFIDTLVGQGSDAAQAGSDLMSRITSAMGSQTAWRSLFEGSRAIGQTAAQGRSIVTAPSGGINLSVTNNVSGVTDPEVASDMIAEKFFRTLSRLDAGGAVRGH